MDKDQVVGERPGAAERPQVTIEGSSYRLRQHADMVPDSLRPKPATPTAPAKRRDRPPKARVPDPIED